MPAHHIIISFVLVMAEVTITPDNKAGREEVDRGQLVTVLL